MVFKQNHPCEVLPLIVFQTLFEINLLIKINKIVWFWYGFKIKF